MNYLSELDAFILTNDPLVHIIKWLSCPDLYNVKHVNKFYNTNIKVLNEIKVKKELKKNLVIEKLKLYENTNTFHYVFFYKFLTLMKYDTIKNTSIDIDIKKISKTHSHLFINWNDECCCYLYSYKNMITEQHVSIYVKKKVVTLEFNNKKSNSKHYCKLRKFFNELNDDNFISTVKKYYLKNSDI